MGLQDALVMSAVPAHDVIKSRGGSAGSAASQSSRDPDVALDQDMRSLHLGHSANTTNSKSRNNRNNVAATTTTTNSKSVTDADTDEKFNVNSIHYDEEEIYEDSGESDCGENEADELRLSRALHFWMPDYVITPLPRQAHTARQPVFSARLGRESTVQRSSSCESLETQLSLFSCSSHGSRKTREKKRRKLKRRKTTSAERRKDQKPGSGVSRWVELANKTKGALDRFMMAQARALTQGFNLNDESEAFELCDADEKRALFRCGRLNGRDFASRLRKADSLTNIDFDHQSDLAPRPRQRTASAGAKTFFGKSIDFEELRRQMAAQRHSALNTPHLRRTSGRKSHSHSQMHRSLSRHSLTSVGSSDVFLSALTPRTTTPPLSAQGGGGGGRVSMWKGDTEILAIDLKRGLTKNVKQRIAITTSALERVTGMGDDNEQRRYTRHLPEFPSFIDDDFALQPKIPQKIRISPHLSDIIKTDIRVRMGRPRYHEIRVQDVQMWSRGQSLDRAHRNLKVFNWLHSLQEREFDVTDLPQDINDVPPDVDDVTFGDMVLIRAVDEPDVKPLFEQKKTYVK